MLEDMSPRTWHLWQVFFALEPFGARQADLRAGVIASVLVNGNPNLDSKQHDKQPGDFFPSLDRIEGTSPAQTAEQLEIAMAALIAAWGAI